MDPYRNEFYQRLMPHSVWPEDPVIDRLIEVADRAHQIWFGHDVPRENLTNGHLNTIGWTVSRYGALSERELSALLAAGAPYHDDLIVPHTPEEATFLAQAAQSEWPLPRRRLRDCVEQWPGADTGAYDPRCCRFPKSCSATVYDPDRVTDDQLERFPTEVPR